MSDFSKFNLLTPIQTALTEVGYFLPTPIQEQTIPTLMAGRDLLGIAQTGTGKTAAFALPILDRLNRHRERPGHRHRATPRNARVLILTPTRELASQIDASFAKYGRYLRMSRAVVYGGVGQNPQVRAMERGVDILVATPGRLLDLINQRHILLDKLEIFVLDEADRMLDMGFIHDIRRIVGLLPEERQTLLFSATMPKDIASLAEGLLRDPVRVEVSPPSSTVDRVDQKVLFVDKSNKRHLLHSILSQEAVHRALVFTRTKHGADKVTSELESRNIRAVAIHGNKSQSAREKALSDFRAGHVRVLVATDIAARGIDVVGITHVINYDLPNEPESYVHRIGRTARANTDGTAISFCDADERPYLRDIERLTRREVLVDLDHLYHSDAAANGLGMGKKPNPNGGGNARQAARRVGTNAATPPKKEGRSKRFYAPAASRSSTPRGGRSKGTMPG
ncbi:MAG: DEAD/DEAH box helicase [Magnetococcales bacterium]|nr:DEAD/DEAH box helicase [Magnetococcales bacterium]